MSEAASSAPSLAAENDPLLFATASAMQQGLVGCAVCRTVSRLPPEASERKTQARCSRCDAPIESRQPNSTARSTALAVAAAVLCVPAYTLPILESRSLASASSDTIFSGVVTLWEADSQGLAIIVFVASVVVPMLKLAGLAVLLRAATRGVRAHRMRNLMRLYRVVDRIGRWSMLDVYVVAILVALLQVQSFAEVRPGPAVLAFAAVVILTMLAAHRFDSRLLWDAAARRARECAVKVPDAVAAIKDGVGS